MSGTANIAFLPLQDCARPASGGMETVLQAVDGVYPALISGDDLTGGDYSRSGRDLLVEGEACTYRLVDYFNHSDLPALWSVDETSLSGRVVGLLAGPPTPGAYAQAGAAGGGSPIGQIVLISGTASVQRADGTTLALEAGSPVFGNDVVETGEGARLSIRFVDGTALSMSAQSRMVLDDLVYDAGRTDNSMSLDFVQGSFVFITGLVAKTGTVQATTPVATMGIRGTTPTLVIEAGTGITLFGIAPDPDGTVGSYQIINLVTGQVIGTVSSTSFVYRLASVSAPLEQLPVDPTQPSDVLLLQDAYQTFGTGDGGQNNNAPGNNIPPQQGGQNNQPPRLDDLDSQFGNLGIEPLFDGGTGSGTGSGSGFGFAGNEGGTSGTAGGNYTDGGLPGSGGNPLAPFAFSMGTVPVIEDQPVVLQGFSINYPNGVVANITAGSTVTLASTDGLTFVQGNGTHHVVIAGPPEAIERALNGAVYTPSQDAETGSLTLVFTDPQTGTLLGTITVPIEITPQNDAPVAAPVVVTVAEDGEPILIDPVFVDPDSNDSHVITLPSGLPADTVSIVDGRILFDPGGDLSGFQIGEGGEIIFQYTVTDLAGYSSTSTISITIQSTNDAPVANDETIQPLLISNSSFSQRPDFAGWTVTTDVTPQGEGNRVTSVNFSTAVIDRSLGGPEGDGAGAVLSFGAWISQSFGIAYGPQVRSDDFAATAGDEVSFIWKLDSQGDYALGYGYLVNAETNAIVQEVFRFDDISLAFNGSTGYREQTVAVESTGTYYMVFQVGSYDWTGGLFVGAQLTLDFAGVSTELTEDSTVTFLASDLLANDVDPDGDPLVLASVGPAASGASVALDGNGNVTYSPDGKLDFLAAGETYTDSFEYTISDGKGGTATAIASFTVTGLNDAPQALNINDVQAVLGEGPISIAPDFIDPDQGDTHIITVQSTRPGTSVQLTPDGRILYDPGSAFELAPGESDIDTFTYTVTDKAGSSSQATVTVTVTAPGEPPAQFRMALSEPLQFHDPQMLDFDAITDPMSGAAPDGNAGDLAHILSNALVEDPGIGAAGSTLPDLPDFGAGYQPTVLEQVNTQVFDHAAATTPDLAAAA